MAEKELSEVAPFCREQFDKGKAAYNRQNYDYAIELLGGVLQLEPAFYEAREMLRATQFKRAKAGKGFFSKVLGRASVSPTLAKAQMMARRKPLEALIAAEQVLNVDPANVAAHKALAEAATAAELPRTALLSLEIAFKQAPADRKLALTLADAYANAGQIGRAEAIYGEAIKANPNDQELQQALKDLAARRTMAEGGYDSIAGGKGSYRDILRDKARAAELEQESRIVNSEEDTRELIERYAAELEQEPANRKLLRSLADACSHLGELEQTLHYLRLLREASGGSDPSIDREIIAVSLKKIDKELAGLDPDDENYGQQRQALRSEREGVEIQSAKELVDRYPSDLQHRFELGKVYFRLGKINEAIGEFQKAQANPHRKIASLGFLGQCFSKRGLHDVAVRTLQKAVDEKQTFDDEKKELIYQLGLALEAMGRPNDAIEQFKQIYEQDIGFKDVAAKVDAFYAGDTQ